MLVGGCYCEDLLLFNVLLLLLNTLLPSLLGLFILLLLVEHFFFFFSSSCPRIGRSKGELGRWLSHGRVVGSDCGRSDPGALDRIASWLPSLTAGAATTKQGRGRNKLLRTCVPFALSCPALSLFSRSASSNSG